MIIISDTSPVVALQHLKLLYLLEQLFYQVIIPEAVHKELIENKIVDDNFFNTTSFIQIKTVINKGFVSELKEFLDDGESEAIALSVELKPEFLLIDEAYGRDIAKRYNIQTKGVLGILVLAKEKGYISQIKILIDILRVEIKFRVSDDLYFKILKQVNEL